ncbi:MAG: amino acid ABC transporter permease [Deltaproteobacteria bacterium]|jgi:polar amino acid transport system permease protein|nr:amino acid ABC transporter permease [Deltaproteobacteria bacterium]
MSTWEFYRSTLIPALNQGLWMSVLIIVPSAVMGVMIGVLAGAGRAAGPNWLKKLLNMYVSVFRGTPLVVQLTMWYYGLPSLSRLLGSFLKPLGLPEFTWKFLVFSPYVASLVAFTLCSGAYQSEYIRGAILSIRKGQFLAAKSLGFTKSQTFWSITAPVAIRRAMHGCGNEIIYLIKYSSLALLVTIQELTGKSNALASFYFRPMECYMLTALYYLALVTLATFILHWIERRLYVPGLGQAKTEKSPNIT